MIVMLFFDHHRGSIPHSCSNLYFMDHIGIQSIFKLIMYVADNHGIKGMLYENVQLSGMFYFRSCYTNWLTVN
jgi:hypothetical protein